MASKSVTQIIALSQAKPELLAELEKFRRNVVVMFADIKGSTAYFERYGDAAGVMMVERCTQLMRQMIERYGGRVIKTIGDATMATFNDCKQSVLASIDMQKALIDFNQSQMQEHKIAIRIGLNYGPGIVRSNDVFGDVVNVASRVESAALPEQILVSESVYQNLGEVREFRIALEGRFAMKGKSSEQRLYEVVWQTRKRDSGPVAVQLTDDHGAEIKAALIVPQFKLQHIKRDGSMGALRELRGGSLTVGRTDADMNFPTDADLAPLHARFSTEHGQCVVEDLSNGAGVFLRLTTAHTLENGDVIRLGGQTLIFREKPGAMSAAAATGTSIMKLEEILHEPVAELVWVNAADSSDGRFPLTRQEITVGRSKADIALRDGFMSRTHAKLYQRGENFFLEDIGSTNGTYIQIRGKTPLPAGSTVLIGWQVLKVQE